jgi:ribose 5-phosphate isomerase B
MRVYLATDHAGFELKEKIKHFLVDKQFDVEDCGAFEFNKDDDYPDFIAKAAKQISQDSENAMGIIFGGSGQAEMMVANKFKNIRCGLFYKTAVPIEAADITGRESEDPYEMIRLIREHNNANMLSLAARLLSEDEAKKAVEIFLETTFPKEERHLRRIGKITKIEDGQ